MALKALGNVLNLVGEAANLAGSLSGNRDRQGSAPIGITGKLPIGIASGKLPIGRASGKLPGGIGPANRHRVPGKCRTGHPILVGWT